MEKTNAKSALIAEAKASGCTVTEAEVYVDLVRWSMHSKPRILKGLRIYEDGTAYDLTVDLPVAKGIRSVASMRKILFGTKGPEL